MGVHKTGTSGPPPVKGHPETDGNICYMGPITWSIVDAHAQHCDLPGQHGHLLLAREGYWGLRDHQNITVGWWHEIPDIYVLVFQAPPP